MYLLVCELRGLQNARCNDENCPLFRWKLSLFIYLIDPLTGLSRGQVIKCQALMVISEL